jgi:outer membrane protein assembly factor BamB
MSQERTPDFAGTLQRPALVGLLAALLLLTAGPASPGAEPLRDPAKDPANEWPIFHNVDHSNFSPTTKLKPPLKVKWMAKVPGKFWTGPVIAEGRLVAQDETGYIFCLDAETGELLWRNFSFGESRARYAPAIFNQRVYATAPEYGTNANGMRCYNLKTGGLIWQKPAGRSLEGNFPGASPQVAGGRLFYIANANEKGGGYPGPVKCQVQCWDAATGDTLWTYTMSDQPCNNHSLVAVGDTVYASAGGSQTVALALDGRPRWSTKDHSLYKGLNYVGQVVHRSGELWLKTGCDGNAGTDDLTVLNAADGSFKRKAMANFGTRQWVFMGERYFGRAYAGPPVAFETATGRRAKPDFRMFPDAAFGSGCGAAVGANGYLYAGLGNTANAAKPGNMWYAWDAATGEPVWSFPNATNCCAPPAIAYDKLYWVCGSDGLIYCFESAQGGKAP